MLMGAGGFTAIPGCALPKRWAFSLPKVFPYLEGILLPEGAPVPPGLGSPPAYQHPALSLSCHASLEPTTFVENTKCSPRNCCAIPTRCSAGSLTLHLRASAPVFVSGRQALAKKSGQRRSAQAFYAAH